MKVAVAGNAYKKMLAKEARSQRDNKEQEKRAAMSTGLLAPKMGRKVSKDANSDDLLARVDEYIAEIRKMRKAKDAE